MKLPAVSLVLLSLAGSACAEQAPDQTPVSQPDTSPAAVIASETETAEEAMPSAPDAIRRIRLGHLPSQGLVMSSKWSTRFLDLSGHVIDEVPGLQITGNSGAHEMWFEMDRSYLRLNLDRGVLIPKPRRLARRRYDVGPEPDLPIPVGVPLFEGDPVGHWVRADESPSGVLLAQWSGECEVPTAYWIEPGGTPQVVTGQPDPEMGSPESVALGWSEDGRALAYLGQGFCGGRGDPPGVYAFTSPGVGELLVKTHHFWSVEMWSR